MPPVSFSCKFCYLAASASTVVFFPAAMCSSPVCIWCKSFVSLQSRGIAGEDLQLMKFKSMVYIVTASYRHTVCCDSLQYQQLDTIWY